MAYMEAFNSLKKALKGAKADGIEGHLAVQINLTDEDASGICYLEVKDGALFVEPYDYYDNDAIVTANSADLNKVFTGKLSLEKAIADGKLTVTGNAERAAELKKLIKVPAARKPAAKKPAASKASKPAEKKPAAPKAAKPAEKKPAAKKAAK